MPTVEVNGTSLAYRQQGTGGPVVFVHGGAADYRVWANQMKAFGEKYRAVALSCRHYYPNEELPQGAELKLDTIVEDLAAFLRALDLAPAHLIGHSSPGAFASRLLARREPGLLRALVLAEPPALPLFGAEHAAKATCSGMIRRRSTSRAGLSGETRKPTRPLCAIW